MGGNQSTRKLQIDNDNDPSTVIKVSEKVVQRIKSGVEREAEAEFKETVKKVSPYGSSDDRSNLDRFQNGVPFVTAKMIRQEVEEELQKNNKYWEHRIANLQKNHEKINQIMEQEYIKAVEEMRKELPKLPDKTIMPCQDKKGSIIKCYKSHSKKPLLCAQEVEAFNCCMRDSRLKLLSQQ